MTDLDAAREAAWREWIKSDAQTERGESGFHAGWRLRGTFEKAGRESRDVEVKRLLDALEEISEEARKFDLVYIEELARAALSEQETPRA